MSANNAGGYFVVFVLGVAAGSFVTWRWLRHSYDEQLQEDVASVRRYYEKKPGVENPENKADPTNQSTIDISKVVQTMGYAPTPSEQLIGAVKTVAAAKNESMKTVSYISPNDFGEEEGYDKIELTYFADGVLADDLYDPLLGDDVNDAVGADFASHFGEYEDDSVYVRNDRRRAYFVVLRDLRTYAEVGKTIPPHRAEIV